MTWPAVEAALQSFDTVLIPIGAACKEHGPHLPLNTDWIYCQYLTRRVVAECRVLAVPPVPYGHYPAFSEYPGSVSIGEETFSQLIGDICQSFVRHGVRKFYALNTGVSTIAALAAAKARLSGQGARLEYTDLHSAGEAARAQVERQSVGTHADEIETSNMLYVAPQVVQMERACAESAADRPGGLTRNPDSPSGVFSPSGSWGDPTLATADKGRIVTEAVVNEIVRFLHKEFNV